MIRTKREALGRGRCSNRTTRCAMTGPGTSSRTGRRYSPPLSSTSGVFQVTPSGLGIGVCVVAPGVLRPVTPWRWLAWLGLVSYGIFLYHQVFVGAFRFIADDVQFAGYLWYTLAVFAAATVCAALSYYIVERPLLRFKEPQRARGSVSAGGARRPGRRRR